MPRSPDGRRALAAALGGLLAAAVASAQGTTSAAGAHGATPLTYLHGATE